MEGCVSRRVVVLLLPLAVVLAGCDMSLAHLTARATDEWTRTYPLTAGGEVRIVNTNGKIEVQGVDGSTVEVRAERIARGATDAAARDLLPRIVIKEDNTPDRVSLETERMGGIMIGAAFEVRYHVRAPKNAVINVTNTNGQVAVTALDGKVRAHTTNGGVNGKDLTGGVDAQSTNGGVTIDMASVGPDSISLHTTNGGVTLTLPDGAKANLSASCTNGGINVSALDKLEISNQSRRRVEGLLNGGGTAIELRTTNGGIRVRPRGTLDTRTEQLEKPDR
jgi:putative adhesin